MVVYVCERQKHEAALMHAGVRYGDAFVFEYEIVVKEYVEV